MTKRPTFFLSSTIYDFRDLRSVIKHTLEERGCRVLASEFNDFGGALDTHSYEACLASIEQADYFVLLVGGRVGGWYDQPNRVSITQQEYRTAYARHQKGLIKIIALVRREVWQLREDREALKRHLETLAFTDEEKEQIREYKSKFSTDAAFVSEFLREIGRNEETAKAAKTGADKPTGNWIYNFENFSEVDAVLRPLSFSGLTSEQAAFRAALKHELVTLLSKLLLKIEGTPRNPSVSLKRYLDENPISRDVRWESGISVDSKKWYSFSTYFISILGLELDASVLQHAIVSDIFLSYNKETSSYERTPAYNALFSLVGEIRKFNKANTTENQAITIEFSPKNYGRAKSLYIPVQKMLMLYGLAHHWIDIIALCVSLLHHLAGRPFQEPKLMPLSPVSGMDEHLAKERLTAGEIETALGI